MAQYELPSAPFSLTTVKSKNVPAFCVVPATTTFPALSVATAAALSSSFADGAAVPWMAFCESGAPLAPDVLPVRDVFSR